MAAVRNDCSAFLRGIGDCVRPLVAQRLHTNQQRQLRQKGGGQDDDGGAPIVPDGAMEVFIGEDGKVYIRPAEGRDIASFAHICDRNIKAQRFADAACRGFDDEPRKQKTFTVVDRAIPRRRGSREEDAISIVFYPNGWTL